MADGASLVKSSYDDVNSALEGLLGNISSGSSLTMEQVNAAIANEASRAEKAEAALQAVIAAVQVPVWMPIPSPSATAPHGYIPANGATFSASQYPQLGTAFPSGKVPDLRGLFIRGLDTTGTIDNVSGGRAILSVEEGSRITGEWNVDVCSFNQIQTGYPSRVAGMQALGWDFPTNQSEVFSTGYYGPQNPYSQGASLNAGNSDPEILGVTRPKNMAWNYVFRAA